MKRIKRQILINIFGGDYISGYIIFTLKGILMADVVIGLFICLFK